MRLVEPALFGISRSAAIIDHARIPGDVHARRHGPCSAQSSRIAVLYDDLGRRRLSGRSVEDGRRQTIPHSAERDAQRPPLSAPVTARAAADFLRDALAAPLVGLVFQNPFRASL